VASVSQSGYSGELDFDCFASPTLALTTGHRMETRAARIGLVLFCVYLALYGGFVFLSAFSAETMEATPVAGVNVAILYGFFLIISAIVLSLIYGVVCGREGESSDAVSTAATSTEESSSDAEGSK
jgi:uncharacterized membrane protein (DUF485 family)